MAEVVQFERGGVVRSLQEPNTGMQLTEGWMPRVARPAHGRIPPDIIEDMPIWIKDTSHDALAGELQELAEMQAWAAEYMSDRRTETPVWLEDQTSGETNQRRVLVKAILGDFSSSWHSGALIPDSQMNLAMQIVRHPYWEAGSASGTASADGIDVLAGSFDYTGAPSTDVLGDVPARLDFLTLNVSAATYKRGWIGFRSANRAGTLANFIPIWECEDGTALIGADSFPAADATASPGGGGNTMTQTSFATTATWSSRVGIYFSDVTANYSDNYGGFKALVRGRVTAGTIAEIKITVGYSSGKSETITREVSSTSWAMHDMGMISIPVRNLRALAYLPATADRNLIVEIQARRTSGAGSLYLDCITMIPADEYFLYIDSAGDFGFSDLRAAVGVTPDDAHQMAVIDPSPAPDRITHMGTTSPSGVGMPIGDGRLYAILTDADNVNSIADTWNASLQYYPRWTTLRGAE